MPLVSVLKASYWEVNCNLEICFFHWWYDPKPTLKAFGSEWVESTILRIRWWKEGRSGDVHWRQSEEAGVVGGVRLHEVLLLQHCSSPLRNVSWQNQPFTWSCLGNRRDWIHTGSLPCWPENYYLKKQKGILHVLEPSKGYSRWENLSFRPPLKKLKRTVEKMKMMVKKQKKGIQKLPHQVCFYNRLVLKINRNS